MTLREYVELIKLEHNINFDTNKIIKHVTDQARKQKEGNVAVLSDDDVKQLVINYREDETEQPKEEKKVEKVKEDERCVQPTLFDL